MACVMACPQLFSNSHLVDAVLENSCGQAITTRPSIEGRSLLIVGEGDLHDTTFDHFSRSTSYAEYDEYVGANNPNGTESLDISKLNLNFCRYRLTVYPTRDFEDFHKTRKPFMHAAITAFVFLFTTLVFAFYDVRVRMRQEKVMESAMRTNNIVTSLFPQNVRDRLYEQVDGRADANNARASNLNKFLNDGKNTGSQTSIADLFPHCTIAFIDVRTLVASKVFYREFP